MLSVTIHKDIGEYEPKIVGKLTLRSLICTALALLFALVIGAYSWFVLGISTNVSMYAIFAVSLPVWMAGFWRPKGMKAEQFIPLWLTHLFTDNRLIYISTTDKLDFVKKPSAKLTKAYIKAARHRAIEAYSPTQNTV